MSAETPNKPYPWKWPALFVAGLAAALIWSSRPVTTPDGLPLLKGTMTYDEAIREAEAMSRDRVVAADKGEKLTDADLKELRKAADLYDQAQRLAPQLTGAFFASGKIHLLLGEDEIAAERFRQFVFNAPLEKDPRKQVPIQLTAAEAHYQLALLDLKKNLAKSALEHSNYALSAVPNSSLYLTARAMAKIQLKQVASAKEDLGVALQLDPSNQKAAGLMKFIGPG